MSRIKLAIVCSHPIQYYAPVFRRHAQSSSVLPRVFYTWSQTAAGAVFDPGFAAQFSWDIPLLEGYDHQFVQNLAKLPTPSRFFGLRNPELVPDIKRWGAEAILVYGWNTYSHLSAMVRLHGTLPVLFRGDSTLLNPLPPLRKWARRALLRWVYSHVDVAVAVGKNSRDYFSWSGLPDDRIAYAPHSVDNDRFLDESGAHAQRASTMRAELGIAENDVVIVYAGKFNAVKDPLLLVEAFLRIEGRAHLVLVGSGDLEPDLRRHAHARNSVHFLPFQNQSAMPAIYQLCDVFALPSRSETWGLGMNEAMASGRPVIASSRVGGARDLVFDGRTGWNFQSGAVDDLSRVLQVAVSAGKDGLRKLGASAQELISGWSTTQTARGIEAATVLAVERARARAARSSR